MTPRSALVLNYALYQTGWFACLLGAAWGWPHAGAAIAAALIVVHVALLPDRAARHSEWRLVGATLAVGLAVEALAVGLGVYERFPHGQVLAWTAPPWLLVLWAQFATTFRWSLRRVMGSARGAAVFGAVGGPVAFVVGERLGAVVLARPLWPGLLWLGASWAAGLAVCTRLARDMPVAGDRSP